MRRSKGLASAFAGFGLWWGAWASSLPAVKSATGASQAQLGLALLAIGVASLPAMLVAGRVSDRTRGRLVPIGLAGFAIAGALPGLASSVPVLVSLLIAVGVTSGTLDISINAQASRIDSGRGVRIMDGLHASFSAGVVVGSIGAGLLRRAGADPSAILAGAGFLILLAAAANLSPPAVPVVPRERARLGRPLVVVGAVLAIAFLLENGLETWSALFLERVLDSGPAVSGLGPGLFAAAMVTGRVLAQRADRVSVVRRMTVAGLAAAAGLALAASATRPLVALAGFVLAGSGLALSAPTLFGVAGRLGGGAALSTVAVLGYLGFLAGPPLFGAIAGATSLRGGFVFLAAAALMLALCAPMLRHVRSETEG